MSIILFNDAEKTVYAYLLDCRTEPDGMPESIERILVEDARADLDFPPEMLKKTCPMRSRWTHYPAKRRNSTRSREHG